MSDNNRSSASGISEYDGGFIRTKGGFEVYVHKDINSIAITSPDGDICVVRPEDIFLWNKDDVNAFNGNIDWDALFPRGEQ